MAVVALALSAAEASGQDGPSSSDAATRLWRLAHAARASRAREIVEYTAVVRERSGVRLRLPLGDRVLGNEEAVVRLRWRRDGEQVVVLVGSRVHSPDGPSVARQVSRDVIFDPVSDQLFFGQFIGDEEGAAGLRDPFVQDAPLHYRFALGDTVRMALLDDRRLTLVELRITPREPSFRSIVGTALVDVESGAVATLSYRPSAPRRLGVADGEEGDGPWWLPGHFKPIGVELDVVQFEYSLFGHEHWMPSRVRVGGTFRAGAVRLPFSREISYGIEDVRSAGDVLDDIAPEALVARWTGAARLVALDSSRQQVREYRLADSVALRTAPELPEPVWAGEPFDASGSWRETLRTLEAATRGLDAPARLSFEVGPTGRDLVRYNRVEGLSMGARMTLGSPAQHVRFTLRHAFAQERGYVVVEAMRRLSGGLLTAAAYSDLAESEPGGRSLGLGASVGAWALGRDYGQYFRADGVRLSLGDPVDDRSDWRLGLFAERHAPVQAHARWSVAGQLDGHPRFTPNVVAEPTTRFGIDGFWDRRWHVDADRPRWGAHAFVSLASGDDEHARARLTGRGSAPLAASLRVAAEVAVGHAWGDVPAQLEWFLGGPHSVRGFEGGARRGTSMARAQLELSRPLGVVSLITFADAGWAGNVSAAQRRDLLAAFGIGASILDGALRIDVARTWRSAREMRVELYMDAMF